MKTSSETVYPSNPQNTECPCCREKRDSSHTTVSPHLKLESRKEKEHSLKEGIVITIMLTLKNYDIYLTIFN